MRRRINRQCPICGIRRFCIIVEITHVRAQRQSSERFYTMSFTNFPLFGNVIGIRQAGQNKVIVLAQATFSKDTNKKSPVYNVMTFARQAKEVEALEAKLAARREETGNEKSALSNVHLTAHLSVQDDGSLQAQLVYLGKKEPKTVEAKEATTETPVAEKAAAKAAPAVDVVDDDVPF